MHCGQLLLFSSGSVGARTRYARSIAILSHCADILLPACWLSQIHEKFTSSIILVNMSSFQESRRAVNRYGSVIAEESNAQDNEMPQQDDVPVRDAVENRTVSRNSFVLFSQVENPLYCENGLV